MNSEPMIRVGLITDGDPHFTKQEDKIRVHNILIGDGFHWQSRKEYDFAGKIKKLAHPEGKIKILNELPIEEYLKSVASSEMNGASPLEFLKAHAVISRSWAMRKINEDRINKPSREKDILIDWEESDSHCGIDVCNDDHCQRYQGISEEININAGKAVDETRGEVLIDKEGNIADTRFSKCCGGSTELFSTCWADIDYDYLPVKEDPWCDLSDMNPNDKETFLNNILKNYDRTTVDFHDWEVRINKSKIKENLQKIYHINIGDITGLEAEERGSSGRIKTLRIAGTEGSVVIGKELKIRRLLSDGCLYSSWFDIEEDSESFILKGHGWGHGVGLCQIGAARMALEGKDYHEILDFYYPGTLIKKIY